MNTTGLRRLIKSTSTGTNIPTFRIVVFGQSGVGKTAMSVRFVTKRFIGEYDPTLENIYQHYYMIRGNTVLFEIMDTAGQEENEMMMEEKMRWADAFILVYAVNDQTSFDEIPRLKFTITHTTAKFYQQHKQVQLEPVISIVGNKIDLERDRMVHRDNGEALADSLRCDFHEISVRDGLHDVIDVFENIYDMYWSQISSFRPSDLSNVVGKKKSRSFKLLDRIPKMEGKRQNYMTNDVDGRHHPFNDVSSDIMRSIIDENAELSQPQSYSHNSGKGRYIHRSTLSLPSDVTSTAETRPPPRTRRNAVVGLSNGIHTSSDEDYASQRRQKLIRASHVSESSLLHDPIQNGPHMNGYDGNNNASVAKPNRRCRSQEHIDLSRSHSMLENFTKRAISFETSNGLTKRFS